MVLLLTVLLLNLSCKTNESTGKSIVPAFRSSSEEAYIHPLWAGSTYSGIVQLSLIRDRLIHTNMVDSYINNYPKYSCPSTSLAFRSTDGRCYLEQYPFAGAAGTRFGRNVPLKNARVDTAGLMKPNPRAVSLELMTREEFIPIESVNLLVAGWIQFMLHDWLVHEKGYKNPLKVPLEPKNPFGKERMEVPETPSNTSQGEAHFSSLNTVTSWWDGSQIYGSDAATARKLRSFVGGRLKIDRNNLLPMDSSTRQELAGVSENWWIGLSLFHHIFVLEHNRIATAIKATHPNFDDEKVFQISRLVNAALMAKIHTVEWTPAVLQHPIMDVGMNANWYGLSKSWDSPTKSLASLMPSSVAFLHGIVGQPVARDFGVPYSLTEEFTTVYRMHQFLPDRISVLNKNGQTEASYELQGIIREQSRPLLQKHGLSQWIYSFAKQSPGALLLKNYPKALQNIRMPDSMNLDLAAVDILRDRERAVPRYNDLREHLDLPRVKSFRQLNADKRIAQKLEELYGDIDSLDAIVGMLAETQRPKGFAFGETQFRIFLVMASRRLFSDPFYTEKYNEKYYTKEGLQWIDENSLTSVLHAHFPDLRSRVPVKNNAFFKW